MMTWQETAEMILRRDFLECPIDDSTIQSMIIGMRSSSDPIQQQAVKVLKETKATKWGKRDIKAGRLLPRKRKENNEPDRDEY